MSSYTPSSDYAQDAYIIDELEPFEERIYTAIVGRNVRKGELVTSTDIVHRFTHPADWPGAPICQRLTAAQARDIRALVVCSVCMRPIEPHSESEWRTMESVGVHHGECWQTLKRDEMLAGCGIR